MGEHRDHLSDHEPADADDRVVDLDEPDAPDVPLVEDEDEDPAAEPPPGDAT